MINPIIAYISDKKNSKRNDIKKYKRMKGFQIILIL